MDDGFGNAIVALVDIVPVDDFEYVYPVESRVIFTLLWRISVEANDGSARLA